MSPFPRIPNIAALIEPRQQCRQKPMHVMCFAVVVLCFSRPTRAWTSFPTVLCGLLRRQPRAAENILLMSYMDDHSSPAGGGGSSGPPETQTPSPLIKNGVVKQTTTKSDYTGAGTLGDIMSTATLQDEEEGKALPTKSGLVTADGGTLEARFGIVSPLDRMALTANGNLQRLFSSYYDAPVHVLVDKCMLREMPGTWDRVVHLTVHNQTFCTAASIITVHDGQCQELVRSGQVGLGQLFRHLDKLPTFTLLDAGRTDNEGGLWRLYELRCDELSCRIREDFVPHAWEICS